MESLDVKHNPINIKGLNKAEILAALYNAAKNNSPGHSSLPDMTIEQAQKEIDEKMAEIHRLSFPFINGVALGVNLTFEVFESFTYNVLSGLSAQEILLPLFIKRDFVNPDPEINTTVRQVRGQISADDTWPPSAYELKKAIY